MSSPFNKSTICSLADNLVVFDKGICQDQSIFTIHMQIHVYSKDIGIRQMPVVFDNFHVSQIWSDKEGWPFNGGSDLIREEDYCISWRSVLLVD